MPSAQKRQRLANLIDALYLAVDDFVGVEIPDVQAQIDALVAVANRTAAQNVDLRALRRDLKLMRFAVRVARVVLLVAGRDRPSDVTGADG